MLLALCGNGMCEGNLTENCVSCPLDCGTESTCGIYIKELLNQPSW